MVSWVKVLAMQADLLSSMLRAHVQKLDAVVCICTPRTPLERWKGKTRVLPEAYGPTSLEYAAWQKQ